MLNTNAHFKQTRRHKTRRKATALGGRTMAGKPVIFEPLESRVMLTTINWIAGHTGDFGVASNWQGGVVPGFSDDAVVQGVGSMVNITDSRSLHSLTSGAGTMIDITPADQTHNPLLTIYGGGSIAGSFIIDGIFTPASVAQGGISVSGTTTLHGTVTGGELLNYGTMTVSNGGAISGGTTFENHATLNLTGAVRIDGGTILTNIASSTINLTDDGGLITSSGSGTLINSGTLNKTGGTGVATVASGINFKDLGGTINVQTGTLSVTGQVDLQDATFNVASGATFSFDETGQSALISGNIIGLGTGHVLFNAGTFYPRLPNNGTYAPATLNFANGMAQVTGANFLSGISPNIINNTGYLDFVGNTAHGTLSMDNSGTIRNTGQADFNLQYGYALTNEASGVIDLQTDASFLGAGTLSNLGILKKSGGTGTSTINSGITLQVIGGTVNVQTGTISTAGPIQLQDVTFNLSSGAVFSVDSVGQNATISGNIIGQGAGHFLFNAGTFDPRLPNNGATADATLNFPDGMAQVTASVFNVSAYNYNHINNTGYLDFVGSAAHGTVALDNWGTIRNKGTADLNLEGGGAITTNEATGVIDLQTDGGIISNGGGAGTDFKNYGTIRKSGGIGVSAFGEIALHNHGGTLDIQTGTIRLTGNSFVYNAGPLNIATDALLEIKLGTGTIYTSGNFNITGGGKVLFSSGYLQGPNSYYGQDMNIPSVLNFAPNTFTVTNGYFNDYTNLINTGTINYPGDTAITSIINRGNVIVGAGSVTFAGLFVNDTTGILNFTTDNTTFVNGHQGLSNSGTILKSGGTGTLDLGSIISPYLYHLYYDNQGGTVEVDSGTINLPNDPTLFPVASFGHEKLAAGSTLKIAAGATLTIEQTPIITTNEGTIILGGAGASFPALSLLDTNKGSLKVLSGATFSTGSTLTNNGSMTIGGHATVTGNFVMSQASGSSVVPSLNFEIAAAAGSSGAALLNVMGNTTLAGDLTAQFANGFAAGIGTPFTVATFASNATGAFAHTTGVAPAFSVVVNPQSIVLSSSQPPTDLSLSAVTAPATFAPGAESTVTWLVTNQQGATTTGSWDDSVYLSSNGLLDASSILIQRVTHSGALADGASYTGSLTTEFPAAVGAYKVIVVTDSKLNVADPDRSNNIAVSSTFTHSIVPALTLGVTTHDTISDHQDRLYRLTLNAGQDVLLTVDYATVYEADLLVRYAALPTSTDFDESSSASTETTRTILITAQQSGDYYVLVHGRVGATSNTSFSLIANVAAFGALSVVPSHGGNTGQVTVIINGSGFTGATTASLLSGGSGGTTISASNVQFVDTNTLYATFDLTGQAVGIYDLRTTIGAASSTLAGAFTINTGSSVGLVFDLVVPDYSRGDRGSTMLLEYSNQGQTDIPAPYFIITAPNTKFQLAGQTTFTNDSIEVLGIGSTGPAGVLAPGASGSIPITYTQQVVIGHTLAAITAANTDTLQGFDLTSLKNNLRPVNVPTDAWNAIWSNFLANVAATPDGLTGLLRNAANALSLQGVRASDVSVLMNYALQSAGNFGTITKRYALTAFGRGQADPYAQIATADADGNVTISAGGAERIFLKQANGTYQATGSDTGHLSLSNGIYSLRETNGQITVYNLNGTLNYFQDINGNRLTASYVGGQIASLVATNGDTYTYTYNSDGRITQITDPVGRMTTYAYDSTNQLLLSITTPAGTTQFTYYTGTNLAEKYAMTSIVYSDGTSRVYTYDSMGRLASQSRGDGSQAVTYTYNDTGVNASGAVTATDALGHSITTDASHNQGVTSVTDGLGNVARIAYDVAGRPSSAISPGGFIPTTTHDATGQITAIEDASGHITTFTYDATLHSLLRLIDANTNQSNFTYDSNGNLIGMADAAGHASTFSFDSSGNQTGSMTAAGRAIATTYNTAHLVTSRTYSDASTITYTYDAHRNLLTAADSINGTTTYTYDAADRLTSVSMPNGLSIAYQYNAGGQLIRKTDQTGFETKYSYNASGQLTQLTDAADVIITAYTYDAAGRLIQTDNQNGTFTTYAYDAANHMTAVVNNAAGGSINSQFAYTYNANGLRTSMTTAAGTTSYSYDANGQLTNVLLPGGRTIAYAYDAVGNRTTVADSAVATVIYSTNNLNEYVTVGSTTYTYDLDGNLLSSTDGSGTTTYTYNARGQLSQVASPGHAITYQYDALGNRVAVIDNGVTTRYLIDPTGLGNIAGEFDGSGAVLSHYVYGMGLTSAISASGVYSFYDFDATGNTADVTNSSGAVSNSYTYLPFGEILSNTGGANLFTFGGQLGVQTTGNGLYFMRVRMYDPNTGRFMQRDPKAQGGGDVNLYRYVGNNPVSSSDPSGTTSIAPVIVDVVTELETSTILGQIAQTVIRASNLPAIYQAPAQQLVAWTAETAAAAGEEALFFAEAEAELAALESSTGLSSLTGASISDLLAASTTSSTATTATAGTSVAALPVTLAATVVLAPLAFNVTDNYLRTHYPDGLPVPVQNVINPVTFQKTMKRPLIQNLVEDFIKLNGHDPDQTQLNTLIQYANAVDNGNATLFIKTHYSKLFYSTWINGHDPNDIHGPAGFGSQGFIRSDQTLPYQITIENASSASAPAQVVVITQQLDSNLDWSTFQLGSMGFGSTTIDVPAGLTSYTTSVPLSSTLRVDIQAQLDPITGLITWTFSSIDPATGDVTTDALTGFLPPNDGNGAGEGFVNYTIHAKSSDITGTTIHAQGIVYFDNNDPINTPVILNTIDIGAPTSVVQALPANENRANFPVIWSGSDDAQGSGIATYNIFVSVDGAPATLWLPNTSATTSIYHGLPGHTYSFSSAAVDHVGNTETTHTTMDTSTSIPSETITLTPGPKTGKTTFTDAAGDKVTVTLTGKVGTVTLIRIGTTGQPGDLYSLTATGTNTTSGINITSPAAHHMSISNVTITGSLLNLTAATTDLYDALSITGSTPTLTLGNVGTAATITIGPAATTTAGTTIVLGRVDDASLTSSTTIKSLTAIEWTDTQGHPGTITAAEIDKLAINGLPKGASAGNFNANMTITGPAQTRKTAMGIVTVSGTVDQGNWHVTGDSGTITAGAFTTGWSANISGAVAGITTKVGALSGYLSAKLLKTVNVKTDLSHATITLTQIVDTKKPAMGTLTVGNAITSTTIRSAGNLGTIKAISISDSSIYAGMNDTFSGLPTNRTPLTSTAATISSLTITGTRSKTPSASFLRSIVAAGAIGKVSLAIVNFTNSATPFGLAATKIDSYSRTGLTHPLLKLHVVGNYDANQDYQLKII